jgi:hypothetical protein
MPACSNLCAFIVIHYVSSLSGYLSEIGPARARNPFLDSLTFYIAWLESLFGRRAMFESSSKGPQSWHMMQRTATA